MAEQSKNFVSFETQGADFYRADSKLGELIDELITLGRDEGQTLAELEAGRKYIKAPVARRDFIEGLLIKPLRKLQSNAPKRAKVIADEYLNWLFKNLGQ